MIEPEPGLEQREALEQIAYVRRLLDQSRLHAARAADYFLLWGVIWIVGYLGMFVVGWLWFALIPAGVIGCAVLGRRDGGRGAVATPLTRQLGAVNLILFTAALGAAIAARDASFALAMWPLAIGVIYLVNGVFIGRDFLVIGAWLSAAGLVAVWLPIAAGVLWLAFAGGGGLLTTGLLLRRQRQTVARPAG